MSKDGRTTVRLGELKERFEDEGVNLSGKIRQLLREYDRAGDIEEAALKRRLKDEERDLRKLRERQADIESDIEEKLRKIDELQDKIKQRQQSTPEPVVAFAQRIRDGKFSEENLTTDNQAVSAQADNVGWPVDRFVREVRERL